MSKKTESAEKYIDDIIKDLPHSKYTQRFHEELLEHMEDIRYNSASCLEDKEAKRHIGDKKKLIECYNDFHNQFLSRLWVLEFILYVILSFPVFISCSMGTIMSLMPNNLPWSFFTITIAVSLIISFEISYAFYRIVFLRSISHASSLRSKIVLIFLLLLLPAIYLIVPASLEFWETELPSLIITSLAMLSAFEVNLAPLKNRFVFRLLPYTALLILWTILFASVIVSIFPATEQRDLIQSMILPIHSIEFAVLAIINIVLSPIFSTITTYKIAGTLVLFLLLFGIYFLLKTGERKNNIQKTWVLLLISYALYLLLPVSRFTTSEMNWSVPAYNISKNIEKDQMGIFYHFCKYANQDEGPAFHYQACAKNNSFALIQESEKLFAINFNGIEDSGKTPFTIAESENSGKVPGEQEHIFSLPDNFECINKNKTFDPDNIRNYLPYSSCEKLAYNGKEIYTESRLNSSGIIKDIAITQDKKWALIITEDSIYGPDSVFLADLRNLQ